MKALAEQIGDIDGVNIYGRVVGVRGLMVEVAGPIHAMSVGARIVVETGAARPIPCEVIGFSGDNAVVMPFAGLEGVRRGCRAVIANAAGQVRPSPAWLGRVLNAMGEPIDGKGPITQGTSPMTYRNQPPPAHSRKRVGKPLDLGVPAQRHLDRARRRLRRRYLRADRPWRRPGLCRRHGHQPRRLRDRRRRRDGRRRRAQRRRSAPP